MRRLGALGVALVAASGCGGSDAPAPEPGSCLPPSRYVADRCLAPGVADSGCRAGTLDQPDGTCRPAGLLPLDCAEGFVHVPFDVAPDDVLAGAGSCEPILPAEPCPRGLMAVPGETNCRPVMDCGMGQWGNIPVDAGTVHVDASFAGASDGSATAPWTSIGEAVIAAAPGSLIAVAAGIYAEDVLVSGKPLRIHAVCPAQVALLGSGTEPATVAVGPGSTGTEILGLAIRGSGAGVVVAGAEQVTLEQVWIHDTLGRGVIVQDLGPTSLTIRDSLLEHNHEVGLSVGSATMAIEASVVRDTLANAQGAFGYGMSLGVSSAGTPSQATASRTLFERNLEQGILVAGSDATIDACVVRDTVADAANAAARGVGVQRSASSDEAARATIRSSLLERNPGVSLLVLGSEVDVEATVMRDTLINALGSARGVDIGRSTTTDVPSSVTVHASLLERNPELGLIVFGSDAVIESTVVRDPGPARSRGHGINVQFSTTTGAASRATVRGSVVERTHRVGIYVGGSEATIHADLIRDIFPETTDEFGRGISVWPRDDLVPSLANISATVVERVSEFGIIIMDSNATIATTRVATTRVRVDGLFGDGFSLAIDDVSAAPASLFVDDSIIEDSGRGGIANLGGLVSLRGVAIQCSAFDLAGQQRLGVPYSFEDRGDTACGCPAVEDGCKAVGIDISPPEPMPPIE